MERRTTDRVVLLGTKGGPALYAGSGNPTSSLVELGGEAVVVDCGLGVTRGLVDADFALHQLRAVIITHLHSDHYLELGPLLHTAWVSGLSHEVRVIGPPGLDACWQHFLASMAADIELRIDDEGRPDLRGLVTIEILDPTEPIVIGSARLSAMHNEHPPLKDTYAICVEAVGKKITFSGDTAYLPALAEFAAGADLLVHEAMLQDAMAVVAAKAGNGDGRLLEHIKRSHSTAEQAGMIAKAAGVKTLALHHLIPSGNPDFSFDAWSSAVRKHWDGPLIIGSDGLAIEL